MRILQAVIYSLVLLSHSAWAGEGFSIIKPSKLATLLKEGSDLWLIDVRGYRQFDRTHIQGSMNMSVNEIKYGDLPKIKQYILIDESLGQREARDAAKALKDKRHDKLFVLEGGIAAWKAEGYVTVGNGDGGTTASVTPIDLIWAIENKVRLRVFDLRPDGSAPMQGSEPVAGRDITEKTARLRNILGKGVGLMDRLSSAPVVVLVVSILDSPEAVAARVAEGMDRMDIRYLSGGYEAYEFTLKRADMAASKQDAAAGQCLAK